MPDILPTVIVFAEEEDDGEDEDEEEEELPPYTVIANDVMTVKLITGKGDAADGRSFQPSYTHQVFRVKATDDADPIHEEMIIGYGAHCLSYF